MKMINYFCKAGDSALSKLNDKYAVEHVARQFSIEHQQFKQGLPMYAQKQEFLDLLHSAQCVVLRGGTGIGKSPNDTHLTLKPHAIDDVAYLAATLPLLFANCLWHHQQQHCDTLTHVSIKVSPQVTCMSHC